jgi:hypothetical protein
MNVAVQTGLLHEVGEGSTDLLGKLLGLNAVAVWMCYYF